MRKIYTMVALAVALATSPAKAEICPLPVAAGAAPVTIAFMGGMAAFALLPAVIIETQDMKPWEQVFPSVEYRFPADKSFPDVTKIAAHGSGKPYHVTVNGMDTIRSDGGL